MKLSKQKAFNERMGRKKFPGHINLAKGGAVVQKFADAGAVRGTQLSDPVYSAPTSQTTTGAPIAAGVQALPASSVPGVGGLVNQGAGVAQQAVGGLGQIAQGIASDFTAQNNFQAKGAALQPGTNADQLNSAYNGAQTALNQQQGLVNTLTPGVGQGAQSQANLTGMLTNQANGQGPNPAQAALNQQTGVNVANQAALMAGQRGAGANAGLIAREAAQQGAATQQQAVGQGATLQAQQQLAAEQNLQNLLQMLV